MIAVVAVLTVAVLCIYSFGGDPTEYCRTSGPLPPDSGVDRARASVEGHWTAFPFAGVSCTWLLASDVAYGTSTIRPIPTISLLLGTAVAVTSALHAVRRFLINRRL